MVLVRKRCGGTGALYTSASFSGQSDFASQKSCVCSVAHITKSACPTVAKKRLLPHSAAPQSMPPHLFRVSRKQRYNTLDFPAENRVPTGMLRAPIGNPAAKRCSLCNPSFSSQVHIQTAKMQLVMPARKMQKEACAGAWHRLPFGRECRRMGSGFFCIPAIRAAGTRENGLKIDAIVMSASKIKWIAILQKSCIII